MKKITKMLPRYGIDGPYRTKEGKLVETPIRFNKAYLWTTTQAIRQGLKITKKKIPTENLIEKTTELCEILI